MSVKEQANSLRVRFPRGGIGSYGNYPWDASYDHDSFLAEMASVSFQQDADHSPYGLTEETFAASMVFPIVAISIHDRELLEAGIR